MRSLLRTLIGALILGVSGPASSAWHRASTPHFIIYADEKPATLRQFAINLEKFDTAVRTARKMPDPAIGDGNRLTVFVVKDQAEVGRLAKDGSGSVAGFYLGRATGSIAVVPRSLDVDPEYAMTTDTIFFHEYAHHLMFQALDRPYPSWLIEGFAEFFATFNVKPNGDAEIGIAPRFRADGLASLDRESLRSLLSFDEQNYGYGIGVEQFYGLSWLLTHYLTFEPSRIGQLDRYLTATARGERALKAATDAFGDLYALGRDINRHRNRKQMPALRMASSLLPTPSIDIVPLSNGGDASMRLRIALKVNETKKISESLLKRIRTLAIRYPGDALVEQTLADAEISGGDAGAAEAAADRALQSDPGSVESMILKGRAVEAGKTSDRASRARRWYITANKKDPENPQPLMYYYRSFLAGDTKLTANAVSALHYASELAPQDATLRTTSAVQFLRDGKIKEARRALITVAYDPHDAERAKQAKSIIALIDAGNGLAALKRGRERRKNETVAFRQSLACRRAGDLSYLQSIASRS